MKETTLNTEHICIVEKTVLLAYDDDGVIRQMSSCITCGKQTWEKLPKIKELL